MDQLVAKIVRHGFAQSLAFHERMLLAGLTPADIPDVAALAKLPVLRKEDLFSLQKRGPNLGGMCTRPLGEFRRIFQSPGPIHDPESDTPDQWRWLSAMNGAGLKRGDIALNCFGYHLSPAGVMFEEGARLAGVAVVPAGIGSQAQQIDAIESLGVNVYVGLPSYLKGLLDKAHELGRDTASWRIRKAICAAEPLPASLRQLLQDVYGIECFNVYGTAECGNLGYEDATHSGLLLPQDALIQICDINSGAEVPHGETGEVVVTLFREDYVLVRFAVGDLSARVSDSVRPKLVGWLGRSADSVKVRGIFVHPRHLDEAMRRVAGVMRYQAVVDRSDHRDTLTVTVEQSTPADAGMLATVEANLQDALKLKCVVQAGLVSADAKPFVDMRKWD